MDQRKNMDAVEQETDLVEASAPAHTRGRRDIHLIAALSAPLDPAELQQAFGKRGGGMAMIDAAGLQAETIRHSEERFFNLYQKAAEAAQGGQLFLLSPHKGAEENGTVGGIRRLATSQQLFFSQLCAALRASAKGQIAPILPFVDTVKEIESARQLIDRAMRSLAARGKSFDEAVPLGILVGTPASLLLSRRLAEEVDFLMIDTDLLCRLSLAVEPASPRFDALLEENAQAILRLVEVGVGNAHAARRFVAICGNMASDPRFLPHFLAMGADGLVVPAAKLTHTKNLLRALR